jgi:hypothetical protein
LGTGGLRRGRVFGKPGIFGAGKFSINFVGFNLYPMMLPLYPKIAEIFLD